MLSNMISDEYKNLNSNTNSKFYEPYYGSY